MDLYPPGSTVAITEHRYPYGTPVEGATVVQGTVVATGDPLFTALFVRVRTSGGHAVFWRGSGWLKTGYDNHDRRWRMDRPWDRKRRTS
jgi:hypothetical protein